MYLKTSELSSTLPDNDFRYFTMLEGIINSVDSNSIVEILRKPNSYLTRITPSKDNIIDHVLGEVLKLHNLLGLHIDLSKSIKTSGKIFFEIRDKISSL